MYDNMLYHIFMSASMNWLTEHGTTLIGPAVVAVAISSIVTVTGFFITTHAAKVMYREKLDFDLALAERKFEFDKELAERRFKYDRDLHAHKRRIELAEEVLADFYQARDIIQAARSPDSPAGDGPRRRIEPWESEQDTARLNSYYRPLARLAEKDEFYYRLMARRYRFIALFGKDAGNHFHDFRIIRREILIAVRKLISSHRQGDHDPLPQSRKMWRITIGLEMSHEDTIPDRLNRIVEAIEHICLSVIQDVAT
jgi:hypothetical protein